MICNNCGYENPNGETYCTKCGKIICNMRFSKMQNFDVKNTEQFRQQFGETTAEVLEKTQHFNGIQSQSDNIQKESSVGITVSIVIAALAVVISTVLLCQQLAY